MSDDSVDPAEHRAPERLGNWLARPGYNVTLLVRRDDGEPLTDEDEERLESAIKEYEAIDCEDRGEQYHAPKEGEASDD